VTDSFHGFLAINSRNRIEKYSPLKTRKVVFPSFEIIASPTIRLDDVKSRRFSMISRSVQTAQAQILKQEDDAIFEALDSIGTENNIKR
jgi:hypothetical protein